jgi:hypothetical protein
MSPFSTWDKGTGSTGEPWKLSRVNSSSLQTREPDIEHSQEILIKHWWFSGKIGRCQSKSLRLHLIRPAPGSIPGRCIEQYQRRT